MSEEGVVRNVYEDEEQADVEITAEEFLDTVAEYLKKDGEELESDRFMKAALLVEEAATVLRGKVTVN